MIKIKPGSIYDFDSKQATQLSYLPSDATLRQTARILRKIKREARKGNTYYETFKYINANVQQQLINRGFRVNRQSTPCDAVYFTICWGN